MNKLNQAYIKAKELVARKRRALLDSKRDVNDTQNFLKSNQKQVNRLPPGQYLTNNFPILDLGYKPMFFENTYRFEVTGEVANPISLTFAELKALPKTTLKADFHCVTSWSKFDVEWGGVLVKDLLEIVKPKLTAKFALQYGMDDYTTNTALENLLHENVIIAYELNGEPLPRDHGGPVRLIIPHLYAWKGSKFLKKIEFLAEDKLGFWEVRGYNNQADPWKEERYADL